MRFFKKTAAFFTCLLNCCGVSAFFLCTLCPVMPLWQRAGGAGSKVRMSGTEIAAALHSSRPMAEYTIVSAKKKARNPHDFGLSFQSGWRDLKSLENMKIGDVEQ